MLLLLLFVFTIEQLATTSRIMHFGYCFHYQETGKLIILALKSSVLLAFSQSSYRLNFLELLCVQNTSQGKCAHLLTTLALLAREKLDSAALAPENIVAKPPANEQRRERLFFKVFHPSLKLQSEERGWRRGFRFCSRVAASTNSTRSSQILPASVADAAHRSCPLCSCISVVNSCSLVLANS